MDNVESTFSREDCHRLQPRLHRKGRMYGALRPMSPPSRTLLAYQRALRHLANAYQRAARAMRRKAESEPRILFRVWGEGDSHRDRILRRVAWVNRLVLRLDREARQAEEVRHASAS